MTFTLDNDVLTGSDNNYTNGFGVTWVSAELDTYDEDQLRQQVGRLLVVPAVRRG